MQAPIIVAKRRAAGWLSHWLAGMLLLAAGPLSVHAQATSSTSNAIDRINFGDSGTDAYSESAHSFVNMGNPTGTGALGLTYREIAPSSVAANVDNAADNEVLTFTMACSPTLQNYLTIQIWGSDTIPDVIYLYTASQGYLVSNYYATSAPEIDFQQATPMLPGRFVYETIPIPLSMTSGNTKVTLTLNAAQSYYYYASASTATTNLPAGATSRPIYSAFTHTNPYLIVASTDPQGAAPSAATATPATYDSAYFSAIQGTLTHYLSQSASNQVYGSSWTAAVNAGTVPAQIIGYFDAFKHPTDSYTLVQWLNNAAVDTSAGNNAQMLRLDMLTYAYVTPNLLSSFYQNSTTEQEIVAALDAYSYMQSLNGCWGGMTAWAGVGATTTSSSNPYGRANAPCSVIEGAGTWALGSAIVLMQNDSSFLAALNQPVSSTLEPGVLRYQAYQTMLVNHINFLTASTGHGHSPNTDQLQATAYVYSTLALRVLDGIYGTSLAQSNATMYSNYLNVVAGLATNQYGGLWVSNGGLSLEFHGTGNGSYDGGYGWDGAYYLVRLAKILNDNGIETASSHPVRTVAINAVHAFSNFIYPSLAVSGSGYANTMREEETLTFRKNLNIGEINAGTFYYAAAEFNDPYALHAFYLEHGNGIIQSMEAAGPWNNMPAFDAGDADGTVDNYLRWYADYVALCNTVNSQPADPSGVTFLNEASHGNGVWADPTGSTIAIQHNGEKLAMVLNWRPLMAAGNSGKPSASHEIVNNLARVHDTTATTDRIATIEMPASVATGASGSYTSGAFGTLYVARYGNYLVGLNWQSSATMMALAPDMTRGTATDLVTGTNYDLTLVTKVSVPASGAVALLQSLPTSNLSASSIDFGSVVTGASSSPQTVTVTNSGTGPLLISAISLAGVQAADFAYTTSCGTVLPANASCSFAVAFTPTAVGARSTALSLTTSASSTPQIITLNGTGTAPSSGSGDFSLASTVTSVTMMAGGSTVIPLTITASNGFNQPIALSCSVASVPVSCTFASPVLTPTAKTTTTQVTVQYPATAAMSVSAQGGSDAGVLLGGAGLAANGPGFGSRRKRRSIKRRRAGPLFLLSLSAVALIAGCGGRISPTATTNTVSTTHTLIITGASGQITHNVTVTLVVTS